MEDKKISKSEEFLEKNSWYYDDYTKKTVIDLDDAREAIELAKEELIQELIKEINDWTNSPDIIRFLKSKLKGE